MKGKGCNPAGDPTLRGGDVSVLSGEGGTAPTAEGGGTEDPSAVTTAGEVCMPSGDGGRASCVPGNGGGTAPTAGG
eukprot:CAMPEP_0172757760 /NCGR_PEP_ID=MMETSP1074-20121228/164429_1 /TAXON_ID=2916 /ORGANISM="Ceratium fusus, Strain PA161109" /LENGTH=75 /DNA_ID=CAMNT_0013591229 /DNA_START=55 /DNA_END=278 /DNA_ORIENTATION=-